MHGCLGGYEPVAATHQHSDPVPICLYGACRSHVDLGVDLDSRVAIVGANGTGKSTLLKLMTGQLEPLDGMVKRHNHLRIGVYHQHLVSLHLCFISLSSWAVVTRQPHRQLSMYGWVLMTPACGISLCAQDVLAEQVLLKV